MSQKKRIVILSEQEKSAVHGGTTESGTGTKAVDGGTGSK